LVLAHGQARGKSERQKLFMLVVKMEEVDMPVPVVKALGEKKSRLRKILVSCTRKRVTGQIGVRWSSTISEGQKEEEVLLRRLG